MRTKSSGGRKAVAEKAPRKVLASSGGSGSSRSGSTPKSGKSKYSGGAPACPRPTPEWQKDITNFFGKSTKVKPDDDGAMPGGSADPDKEIIEDQKENVDANIEDSEEAGASGSGSSGSSSQFKKNGIISDSEEED